MSILKSVRAGGNYRLTVDYLLKLGWFHQNYPAPKGVPPSIDETKLYYNKHLSEEYKDNEKYWVMITLETRQGKSWAVKLDKDGYPTFTIKYGWFDPGHAEQHWIFVHPQTEVDMAAVHAMFKPMGYDEYRHMLWELMRKVHYTSSIEKVNTYGSRYDDDWDD